jgi:hypothetical protein
MIQLFGPGKPEEEGFGRAENIPSAALAKSPKGINRGKEQCLVL